MNRKETSDENGYYEIGVGYGVEYIQYGMNILPNEYICYIDYVEVKFSKKDYYDKIEKFHFEIEEVESPEEYRDIVLIKIK